MTPCSAVDATVGYYKTYLQPASAFLGAFVCGIDDRSFELDRRGTKVKTMYRIRTTALFYRILTRASRRLSTSDRPPSVPAVALYFKCTCTRLNFRHHPSQPLPTKCMTSHGSLSQSVEVVSSLSVSHCYCAPTTLI